MNRNDPVTPFDWQDDAACAEIGTEMFFPDRGASSASAKRVCGSCDARTACLSYALETNQTQGIWGGTSPREREKLRKAAS